MGIMGASGRTLRSAEVSEGAPTSCVQMACGMCYTRAGDADLLGRGHWLGCFSIEYERGVVGVESELLISTGSYCTMKACKATFLLLACLERAYLSSSHPMSRV